MLLKDKMPGTGGSGGSLNIIKSNYSDVDLGINRSKVLSDDLLEDSVERHLSDAKKRAVQKQQVFLSFSQYLVDS